MSDEPFKIPAPRENPELVGHEWAERQFLGIRESGRMPHAWLITGPRGIGKATFAYRAARYLLANPQGAGDAVSGPGLFGEPEAPAAPENLYVAPDHPVFRRTAAGGHADLLTVQRGVNPDNDRMRTEITVSEVHAAGAFLRLTAAEGGWRAVVVDSADELNATAANALLKFLEEPPSRVILLLVSHVPGRLLPTIRSRCSRLNLRPLAEDAVLAILARHRPVLTDEDRLGLARLAEGSPGRALALAEEGGLELYREMIALFAALPRIDGPELHGFGDRLARSGQEGSFRIVCELMGWWIARMIKAGAQGQGAAPVVPEEAGFQARLLAAAGLDRWMEVWEKITRLADRTDRLNLDRKQSVLTMFHALQRAMSG
ncbi:MAG: DNA polymerase III subunit delta' [Alphaproteobacteria bacterium]